MERLENKIISKSLRLRQIPSQTIEELTQPIQKLDTTIEQYLQNLEKLNIQNSQITQNVHLIQNAEEFIQATKLRYQNLASFDGFLKEFPTPIQNYHFDEHDKHSINLYYKQNNQMVGVFRIVLDSEIGLASDSKYDETNGLNHIREQYKNHNFPISELTRLAVNPNFRGGNILKELFHAKAKLAQQLDIGSFISSCSKELFHKVYEKIGMEIIKELPTYGAINVDGYMANWDREKYTQHFYKFYMEELK